MGTSAEELRAADELRAEELRYEIAGTREHLGSTLDAIGDRVSPARVIERKKNQMTMSTRSFKDRIMGTMSDAGHSVTDTVHGVTGSIHDMPETVKHTSQGSPLLAGGVAFGLGLLAAVAFPATNAERHAAATLMEKAEPLKDEMKEVAHDMVDHLKEPATHAVQEVKSTATEAAGHVAETGKQTIQDTKEQATNAASDLHSGS